MIRNLSQWIMRLGLVSITVITLTSCSEFALLASGSSIAVNHNAYVKAYNGIDVLTIMQTDKGIKTHAYERGKEWIKKTRRH